MHVIITLWKNSKVYCKRFQGISTTVQTGFYSIFIGLPNNCALSGSLKLVGQNNMTYAHYRQLSW